MLNLLLYYVAHMPNIKKNSYIYIKGNKWIEAQSIEKIDSYCASI